MGPDVPLSTIGVPDPPRRPQSEGDLGFTRQKPVRWFQPSVLVNAAQRVLLSSAFGDFLDKRELQAANEAKVLSHHHLAGDAWIDYVADTGDGFDATYSIAWLTAQRELRIEGLDRALPRAGLLVLGGDEVYPVAGSTQYDNRFRGPYKASLPHTMRDSPEVVAVPGNHDWYDGLTNFIRLFCSLTDKWIGGRRTVQTRSYFAVRLPHDWWLWGIDIQLDAYIDDPQLQYFKDVAQTMGEGARLILCTAKPSWTDVNADPEAFRNLGYLESQVIRPAGVRLLLSVSGDSHHYVRYASEDGRQKITAGGGGAFLHPTHHLDDSLNIPVDPVPAKKTESYRLRHRYPAERRSRWMSLGAIGLPLRNLSFFAVPAVLYLLLGWSSQFANRLLERRLAGPLDQSAEKFGWFDELAGLGRNPVSVLLLLVIVAGLVAFAQPAITWSRGWRGFVAKFAMGLVHFAMQLAVGLTVGLVAIKVASPVDGAAFVVVLVAALGLLGGLAGGFTLGAYLAVCCFALRAHGGEAFSSMALTRYKNFLRLHIDERGMLTIYPIGLDRPTKKWQLDRDNADPEAPWLAPDGDGPRPHLIEDPIVIDPRTTSPPDHFPRP